MAIQQILMPPMISSDHIIDTLGRSLPGLPRMRTENVAASSRGPSNDDFLRPVKRRLAWLVYDEGLVDRLVPLAVDQIQRAHLNPLDELAYSGWPGNVHPKQTHTYLTPVINSEHDSREWIQRVIVLPAVACIRAVYGSASQGPYVASSPSAKHRAISDGLLYKNDSEENCVLSLEYKTHNALRANTLQALYVREPHLEDQGGNGVRAIRFVWPEEHSDRIEKSTKVLVQVWGEMVDHDVKHAVLSSLQLTIFFYRTGKDDGTLYYSRMYNYLFDRALLVTYTWMVQALGHLRVQPDLPDVDPHWKELLGQPLASEQGFCGVDIESVNSLGREIQTARRALAQGARPTRAARRLARYLGQVAALEGVQDQAFQSVVISPRSSAGDAAVPGTVESEEDTDVHEDGRSTPQGRRSSQSPATTPKASRVAQRQTPSFPPEVQGEGISRGTGQTMSPTPVTAIAGPSLSEQSTMQGSSTTANRPTVLVPLAVASDRQTHRASSQAGGGGRHSSGAENQSTAAIVPAAGAPSSQVLRNADSAAHRQAGGASDPTAGPSQPVPASHNEAPRQTGASSRKVEGKKKTGK
ncbi:hypothetical protein NEOLEDRAFT_1129867 [Neolentinus lepideus HHB14362 ss-1]|uniref:Uncharacterized protein n=1 Tax=Neolentinus lepideus HHB14362 ss-1 TaxID=1314782 RepID=A0A165UD30_9AGAM|nr:hypothetical protein NEOLEDRAFT_1129867 [Neolentinus lepideus HHB14362 ss-1]